MMKSVYCLLFLVVSQVCLAQDDYKKTYDMDKVVMSIMADNDYEVKEALKWGLDPNTMVKTPNADHTLLTLCAEAGSPKVAEVLIKYGADVELENSKYWRPLQVCSEFGSLEVTKVLLKYGADVNSHERVGENTALHVASYFVYPEIQKVLLEAGADFELTDVKGETCLHKAAYVGFPECVKILLAVGANPNAKREDDKTPLHYAAMEGHPEPTKDIIVAGGDVKAVDVYGNTPYDLAVKNGKKLTIEVLKPYMY